MAMYHGNIVLGVPDSSAPRFHDIAHTDATAFVSSCPACGDTGEVGALLHQTRLRDADAPLRAVLARFADGSLTPSLEKC
jgi:hypothetical protein